MFGFAVGVIVAWTVFEDHLLALVFGLALGPLFTIALGGADRKHDAPGGTAEASDQDRGGDDANRAD